MLLGLGAVAYAVMALGNPVAFVLADAAGLRRGMGLAGPVQPGRRAANPDAPGAATGITQTGTYLGAMAGPAGVRLGRRLPSGSGPPG